MALNIDVPNPISSSRKPSHGRNSTVDAENLQISSPKMSSQAKKNGIKLPPANLLSPKSKFGPKASPQNLLSKTMSPKLASPPLPSPTKTTTIAFTGKTKAEFSDFMVNLYKGPAEKNDIFTNSFVSFRYLANIQSQKLGATESDEVFLPSHQTERWKAQLNLNKKQENLFRKTIQEVFHESQNNFYKLLKDNDKRKNQMPYIRVYHNVKDIKNESTKQETEDNETPEPTRNTKNTEKIPEYASRLRLGPDEPYKFYEYPPADLTLRVPNAREGATLTLIGKNVYLYGGVSKELYNEIERLNTDTFLWEKVQVKGDIPVFGRLGHSADSYMNSMVIFGGEKNYNTTLNIRECLNDTRFFITDTNEWKYLKCYGELVEPRRNHVGVVVGKHLVVHGGIDTHGTFLNDLKILDLITGKWSVVDEVNKDVNGIAFHKACLVLSSRRKEVNLFKLPELKPDENAQKIAEEGIYFFGGKNELGEPLNTLRILKIGSTPFKWVTPTTEGRTPDARFAHVMMYSRKLNMLIVHGGRSDGQFSTGGTPFLGDFSVLQLENLTWVNVVLKGVGFTNTPRCSHASVVIGTKLLIFGGIYFGTYCAPEPKIMQMDQMVVHKLEQNKKENPNKSVDLAKQKSENLLAGDFQEKNYDGMVSFLPMPKKKEKRYRKLKIIPKDTDE